MTSGKGSATRRALVVGAGLTGAALAWMAVRAGYRTVVVSSDRPATQATALTPGVVHGVGPPGDPILWSRMALEEHRLAQLRSRRGYAFLRQALLGTPRSVGLGRMKHEIWMDREYDARAAAAVAEMLAESGAPVRLLRREAGASLVREPDSIVSRRRLTFELLRQARERGATLRVPEPLRRIRVGEDGARVLVDLGGERESFDRVFWADGLPYAQDPSQSALRGRAILYQLAERGPSPLPGILETAEGTVLVLPEAMNPEYVAVVRFADEAPDQGLGSWPEIPVAWSEFVGRVVRQRLASSMVGPSRRSFLSRAPFVSMTGLSAWPVASLLGACAEVTGSAPSGSA